MPYSKQGGEGSFQFPDATIPTSQFYSEQNDARNPYLVGRQRTFRSLAMPVQTEETVRDLVKLEHGNANCKDAEKSDLVDNNNVIGLVEVIIDESVQIKYSVEGLRNYELAVKGVHVDQRILPGFKYRVRTLGGCKNRYLLKGEALHLLNIGLGYGKRLTFESTLHNINSNYFWSDSSDQGYGFSLVAVECGDNFTICNLRRRPIGHAVIEDVDPSQMELHSEVNGEEITKEVSLRMRCRVRYTCEPHGMMSLRAEETVLVNGLAVVTKSQKTSKAITQLIKNIELMSIGPCLFVKEQ